MGLPEVTFAASLREAEVWFGATRALPRTSLDVSPGEVLALMGPSGSGKSTLLGLLAGTVQASSGAVEVLGMDVGSASPAERAEQRRRALGLVFQDGDLLPELNARENVGLLMILDGVRRAQALAEADNALASVGLEGLGRRTPSELSGGERQRVAIARALGRPSARFVIADEPTASLDRQRADEVVETLVASVRRRGATLVMATHDPEVASVCDRTHILDTAVIGQPTA
ncbi:ABC transporter ATP-binding protein [Nostocoides sp. Soil756]|uniref:ABC transporter ATP-binding protein n=1 Tax=Nostocoides sp. Soil756 TaxID=1736399 RepID=UPI0019107524|nr:ABC transporter ATP-binding protein [Tetrasphaera sp. Soil756]